MIHIGNLLCNWIALDKFRGKHELVHHSYLDVITDADTDEGWVVR